jgi:hypothetical protein
LAPPSALLPLSPHIVILSPLGSPISSLTPRSTPAQVQRGFYNGLPLTIAVDQLPRSLVQSGGVVASGQPSMLGGDITGFVDPRTGDYREIPLERWLQVRTGGGGGRGASEHLF